MNKKIEAILKLIDDIEQSRSGQEEPRPTEAQMEEFQKAIQRIGIDENFENGITVNVKRGFFDDARKVTQNYRPSRAWLGLLVLGLAILLSALYGGLHGMGELTSARASKDWPTAPGKVIHSEAVAYQSTSSNRDTRSTSTYYKPEITYFYEVDGTRFQGKRLSFGLDNMSRPEAEAKIALYPKDTGIQVHYNPDNPKEAALETGMKAGTLFLLIFCTVLALVGLGLIIAAFRMRKA